MTTGSLAGFDNYYTNYEWYNNPVELFLAGGVINSDVVQDTMSLVDRADFCEHSPYQDSPQTIGHGVTISAPHMVCSKYRSEIRFAFNYSVKLPIHILP